MQTMCRESFGAVSDYQTHRKRPRRNVIAALDGFLCMRYKWAYLHQAPTDTTTIYIRLFEGATTCLRPTEALRLAHGTHRVLPTTNYDPTDEVWEFAPGATVHCESFDGQGGPYLQAIAKAGVDGSKKGRATRLRKSCWLTFVLRYLLIIRSTRSGQLINSQQKESNEISRRDRITGNVFGHAEALEL
jgi:hypothetical protein